MRHFRILLAFLLAMAGGAQGTRANPEFQLGGQLASNMRDAGKTIDFTDEGNGIYTLPVTVTQENELFVIYDKSDTSHPYCIANAGEGKITPQSSTKVLTNSSGFTLKVGSTGDFTFTFDYSNPSAPTLTVTGWYNLNYRDASYTWHKVPMNYDAGTQTYSVQVAMAKNKDFYISDASNVTYGSAEISRRFLTESNSTAIPLAADGFNMSLNAEGPFTFVLTETTDGKTLTVTGWPEPYAVLDGSTLTFYYDGLKDSRPGTKYTVEWNSYPEWYDQREAITTVDFNSLFGNYHGLTNLSNMFNGMINLTAINGLWYLNTEKVTDMSYMFYRCQNLMSINLSHFNTSKVLNMEAMFFQCYKVTELDVTHFNTDYVQNMGEMFESCLKLESLDLTHFNTSSVNNMFRMFYQCIKLTTLDLRSFDTSMVTNMGSMFYNDTKLTTIYCNDNWSPGIVTNSTNMFAYCTSLVGAVAYDSSRTDLAMANPTRGYFTCDEAYAVLDGSTLTFYYDLLMSSRPGTKYYVSISPEWQGNSSITTVDFDESFADYEPEDLSNMFKSLTNLTTIRNIDRLNTAKVKYMTDMFMYCNKLQEIDLSTFNAPLLLNAQAMFWGCRELTTVNLWNFTTTSNTNLDGMFYYCSKLKTIYCPHTWSCQEGTSSNMFYDCTSLKGAVSYSPGNTGIAYANPNTGYFSRPTEAYAMLSTDKTTLTFYYDDRKVIREGTEGTAYPIPWSGSNPGWINSGITTASFDESFDAYHGLTTTNSMFRDLYTLSAINNLHYLHTENVTDMQSMFQGSGQLTELDVSSFNTAKVTNMSRMFYWCSELKTIYSGADWSQGIVSNSTNMFGSCSNLVGAVSYNASNTGIAMANPTNGYFTDGKPYAVVDQNMRTLTFYFDFNMSSYAGDETKVVCNIDTGWEMYDITSVSIHESFKNCKLTSTKGMFANLYSVTAIEGLENLNTEHVTDMSGMFAESNNLEELDLSHFNTSQVTDMSGMFLDCVNLTSLNLSSFNTQNVTDMGSMFNNCISLKNLDLTRFNTSKVTNMKQMFYTCGVEDLNLTCFDTGRVTNMVEMFSWCGSLTSIYCNDNWQKTGLQSTDMFNGCLVLEGAVPYDSSETDAEMANPDNGYFSRKVVLGDVNNDKQVTIADVTALDNILLGKDTAGAYTHGQAQDGEEFVMEISKNSGGFATSSGPYSKEYETENKEHGIRINCSRNNMTFYDSGIWLALYSAVGSTGSSYDYTVSSLSDKYYISKIEMDFTPGKHPYYPDGPVSITVPGSTARAEVGETGHFIFENVNDKTLKEVTLTVSTDDDTTHLFANTSNFFVTLKSRLSLSEAASDVNEDGEVTTADVKALVNMILGK